MHAEKPDDHCSEALHAIKQPLNVIRLAGGNIRARIGPEPDSVSAIYLSAKIDQIDEQVRRAAELGPVDKSAVGISKTVMH